MVDASRWSQQDVNMMTRIHICIIVPLLVLLSTGCEKEETISETPLPTMGTVSGSVVSTFGLEDQATGINLPDGLQVRVTDSAGSSVGDAIVRVWPAAHNPETMAHQGRGRYEIDVLNDRREIVESDYFFEVVSELIEPNTVVLRVPHQPLLQQPVLTAPEESSDHMAGVDLLVSWEVVPGADCYAVSTRNHTLDEWTHQAQCISENSMTILGAQVQEFSFIRVKAIKVLGDEEFVTEPYYSYSSAAAQVRIFLEEPPG